MLLLAIWAVVWGIAQCVDLQKQALVLNQGPLEVLTGKMFLPDGRVLPPGNILDTSFRLEIQTSDFWLSFDLQPILQAHISSSYLFSSKNVFKNCIFQGKTKEVVDENQVKDYQGTLTLNTCFGKISGYLDYGGLYRVVETASGVIELTSFQEGSLDDLLEPVPQTNEQYHGPPPELNIPPWKPLGTGICRQDAARQDLKIKKATQLLEVGTTETVNEACTGIEHPNWVGDGYCDSIYNIPACGYDGGDCCPSTCIETLYTCGSNGYTCVSENGRCIGVLLDSPDPWGGGRTGTTWARTVTDWINAGTTNTDLPDNAMSAIRLRGPKSDCRAEIFQETNGGGARIVVGPGNYDANTLTQRMPDNSASSARVSEFVDRTKECSSSTTRGYTPCSSDPNKYTCSNTRGFGPGCITLLTQSCDSGLSASQTKYLCDCVNQCQMNQDKVMTGNSPVVSQDICLYPVAPTNELLADLQTSIISLNDAFVTRQTQYGQPGRGVRFTICDTRIAAFDTNMPRKDVETWILNNVINPNPRGMIVALNPADGSIWCNQENPPQGCSIVGWSRVGVMCGDQLNALIVKDTQPYLVAHELGHAFGLLHEPNSKTIMEPIVGIAPVWSGDAQSKLTAFQVKDWGTKCYYWPS